MNNSDEEILASLTEILGDLLGDDSLVLTRATRREDVPDWDSLMYVNFIAMVEIRFNIKFKVSEMESFQDVGAVASGVRAKISAR